MTGENFQNFQKIENLLKHHPGIVTEDFQHKLDLVVEGLRYSTSK